MATFKRFEDINAWQKARELTKSVYMITKESIFYRDQGLREQIRRASISVMSNIAEGFGRGGKREFIQFLSIAKGSVTEIQSHLYVALDMGYINQQIFDKMYKAAEDINCMIYGLMSYLQKTPVSGIKYKQ
ncbi:four helix bundle protein [candidate division TA06 bacterium]|uniref:Four helix bundle protein n=1 Tax=candidate division TA06 bacterium TaxID=2250710 RepID=A0A933IA11_UNCT6|nr:four helix bundle protein [candidate division TA06 bacterium]